jgi:hypothetical protein
MGRLPGYKGYSVEIIEDKEAKFDKTASMDVSNITSGI